MGKKVKWALLTMLEVERQQAIREKTARKEVKKAQRAREKEAPASKNE